MDNIAKIDPSNYVTVQGPYAVVNEGTGYAIIDIKTQAYIARNITSFLDCVKTLEHLSGKIPQAMPPEASNSQTTSNFSESIQQKTPHFGVRDDVQKLIEKYAPQTIRVEKEVNWNRSKYRCFDAQGNYLGKVKGKLRDRYWVDQSGQRLY